MNDRTGQYQTCSCGLPHFGALPVYPPHAPDRRAGFILAAAGSPGARQGIEGWLQHLAVA